MQSFCFCFGDEEKPTNIDTEPQLVEAMGTNDIDEDEKMVEKEPSLIVQNPISIFEMTDEEKAAELDGDTRVPHMEHPTNSASQHSNLYWGEMQKLPDIQQEILDNNELKELSMQLLTGNGGEFTSFVDKYFNEKVLNKMWTKLDNDNNGYIETTQDISDAIAFMSMLFKLKMHQKNTKSKEKPKFNKEVLVNEVRHVSTWIVRKHGTKNINTIDKLYIFKITKETLRNNLKKWLDEYTEYNGF